MDLPRFECFESKLAKIGAAHGSINYLSWLVWYSLAMIKHLIVIFHLPIVLLLSSCSMQAVEPKSVVDNEPEKQNCGRSMTQRSKCKSR